MSTVVESGALPPAARDEIIAGLSAAGQKRLPCWYLYDEVGSALFEAITSLPEYGLTRADLRLLQRLGPQLPALLPGCRTVAELGCGSGRKTGPLLQSLLRAGPVRFIPIEISGAALENCRRQLNGFDGLRFEPQAAAYFDGLRRAVAGRDGPVLVLFLGSSIGNFRPRELARFLARVRTLLRPGDALLVGADQQHHRRRLLAAYNDAAGVTAAFNRNVLARLGRDFGAAIDPTAFCHQVRLRHHPCRVEMHLRARRAQLLRLAPGVEIPIAAAETIHTETCRKFRPGEIAELAAAHGFTCRREWIDHAWPFAETLLLAA